MNDDLKGFSIAFCAMRLKPRCMSSMSTTNEARCHACGGPTGPAIVDHTFAFQGGAIAVRNIPATLRTQCGERTFSAATVRRIEVLRRGRSDLKLGDVEFVTIPAVDFDRIPT